MVDKQRNETLSDLFLAKAERLEKKSDEPGSVDDPRWLKRMAGKWRGANINKAACPAPSGCS